MRLLRAGHDPDNCRAAATESKTEPGASRRSFEREPLPMLWLHEHPQSRSARGTTREGGPMKTALRDFEFTEPERYEQYEGPFYHFEISRREFVQVLGAGLVISVAVPSAFAQRAGRGGGGGGAASL